MFNKKLVPLLIFFIFTRLVSARDINLDEIYLKPNSRVLNKLLSLKLEAYNNIKSTLIDKNIIFAGWTSGKRIIYIKEFKNYYINKVFLYYPETRIKKMHLTIKGAIIQTKLSQNGKLLIIKKTLKSDSKSFQNIIEIYNLHDNQKYSILSESFFNDFSLDYFGNKIIMEKFDRVLSFNPANNKKQIIFSKKILNNFKEKSTPILLFFSPDNIFNLALSGGGGSYKGYLLKDNIILKNINSITSSEELYWINNQKILFRTGGSGHYRISLYDMNNFSQKTISSPSFNTNLSFSVFSKTATFLEDGIIVIYNTLKNKIIRIPLEGEDIVFSPSGNKFLSLFGQHLFLSHKNNIINNSLMLQDNSKEILNIYKQAYAERSTWKNSYSKEYIIRKIKKYKNF